MSFRYRILFYHENQKWVSNIVSMLDVPLFHLFLTNSGDVLEEKLRANEVEIILTGLNTRHLLLTDDEDNSMSFKHAHLWEVMENQKRHCQVILLCTSADQNIATDLVQKGRVADYFIINPMQDRERLFISLFKAVEVSLFRELIQSTLSPNEKLPRHLLESIEKLQTLLLEVSEPVAQPMPQSSWSFETDPQPQPVSLPLETPVAEEPAFSYPNFFQPNAAIELTPSADPLATFSDLKQSLENPMAKPATLPDLGAFQIKPETPPIAMPHSLPRSEFDILLIDNDPDNITTISGILSQGGFKIRVATTAEEGFYYLNRELYSIMLLNLEMPDSESMEFIYQIRVNGPQHQIPIIVMANKALEEHVVKGVKIGANYFIVKPFEPVRLTRQVAELMKAAQAV